MVVTKWFDVFRWARDSARTKGELLAACQRFKLRHSGTKEELRAFVIEFILEHDLCSEASWTPPDLASAKSVPPPVPTPVETPSSRKEDRMAEEKKTFVSPLGALAVLIAALALVLSFIAWDNSRDDGVTAAQPQVIYVGGESGDTDSSATTATNSSDENVVSNNSTTSFNGTGGCKLDKIGTWSEGNGPFRIEVGGHMTQHFDFYPAPGVPAVSYVVPNIADPEGVPNIAHGYGSMWEGPSCDFVADATHYVRARLDSGHSGLVVMWGTWEVLVNVNNYGDVDGLLATHRGAMEG